VIGAPITIPLTDLDAPAQVTLSLDDIAEPAPPTGERVLGTPRHGEDDCPPTRQERFIQRLLARRDQMQRVYTTQAPLEACATPAGQAIISGMREQLDSGSLAPFLDQPDEWPAYQRLVKRGIVR
jgi:hypothetical protein